MANLNKLLLAGGLPPGNNSLNHFDKLFAQKIGDSGVITTATGNPVSIITNKAQNAISTILSYSPKQTGSGDPSPQNIRPIEGWTEANLFGCGKNLCDAVAYEIPANSNWNTVWEGSLTGELTVSFDNTTVTAEIPTAGRFIRLIVDGETEELYFRNRNKTITGTLTKIEVIGSNAYVRASGTLKMQVEVGNQATAYEPYTQGANITANLGDTYYGFSMDVERGVLRATYAIVDLGDLSWNYNPATATTQRYFNALVSDCAIVDRYTIANALCDIYKVDTWRHLYDLVSDKSFAVSDGNTNHSIYIRDTDYDNAIDFTTAVSGHKIVYPLSEPIELPLTPQTVALLKGNNTLWTDGDSLSVTYKAKKG